jgi:hypothetical protein
VRVGTPLGEYPFEFRRLERRGLGVAIVGNLAGFESSVLFGPEDVGAVLKRAALPLAVAALALAYARSR